jgi:hypothetical protein
MKYYVSTLSAFMASVVFATNGSAQCEMGRRSSAPSIGTENKPVAKRTLEEFDDPQLQARNLLTGEGAHQAMTARNSLKASVAEDGTPHPDPQEQARRMILGTPEVANFALPVVAHSHVKSPSSVRAARSDPQEMARRMILGTEAASATIHEGLAAAARSADPRH